jgi:putative copper export protein
LPYGRLLLVKLISFLGMLALAGLNRFVLVPKLQGQDAVAPNATALCNLKLSIAVEMGLGLGVLLLVASLGLLDPSGA